MQLPLDSRLFTIEDGRDSEKSLICKMICNQIPQLTNQPSSKKLFESNSPRNSIIMFHNTKYSGSQVFRYHILSGMIQNAQA